MTDTQTNRQTDRQTDKQTDIETDNEKDTDRQTDKLKKTKNLEKKTFTWISGQMPISEQTEDWTNGWTNLWIKRKTEPHGTALVNLFVVIEKRCYFSRVHATLHFFLSVCGSLGRLVRRFVGNTLLFFV